MGKQYNKVLKRKRLKARIKRKKAAAKLARSDTKKSSAAAA